MNGKSDLDSSLSAVSQPTHKTLVGLHMWDVDTPGGSGGFPPSRRRQSKGILPPLLYTAKAVIRRGRTLNFVPYLVIPYTVQIAS